MTVATEPMSKTSEWTPTDDEGRQMVLGSPSTREEAEVFPRGIAAAVVWTRVASSDKCTGN